MEVFKNMKYVCLAVLCFAWILSHAANSSAYRATEQIRPSRKQIDSQTIRNLPLRFEANQGQAADDIRYLSRGPGYSMALSARNTVLHLGRRDKRAALTMRLDGAQNGSQIRGLEPLATTSSYFLSNDPRQWRSGIPNFGRVSIEQVYPGIDLQWHGNGQQLEYDFNLAAGADPALIHMRFDGAKKIRIAKDGSLRMILGTEEIEWQRPVAYQMIDGRKLEINCRYRLRNNKQVRFELGAYDRSRPLVIDPVLVFSTPIGGSGFDNVTDVAVDAMGFLYVSGQTESVDFPGTSPLQMNRQGRTDAFVLKINPAGTAVVYGTWIGGTIEENAYEIAVDPMGQAYLTGITTSDDFPTRNPVQATRKGGIDAFLTKLNAAGNDLVFSTYLGGSLTEFAFGVGFDAAGNGYVGGYTESFDFPVKNALQPARQGSAIQTTVNGGTQWAATGTGLNAQRVNDIAILPSNPSIIHLATEQGVYKTSDNGATWARLGNGFNRSIQQILIDPRAPNNLFVLSQNNIFRSTDGGANWTQIISLTGVELIDLSPTQPAATLFAATSTLFLRSTDGGITWTSNRLPPVPDVTTAIFSLAVDPSQPMTVYAGGVKAIYRSTDGGATWTINTNGIPNEFSYVVGRIRVSPANGSVLLAEVGGNGVFKSIDGGANWTSITIPAPPLSRFFFVFDASDANTIYVALPSSGMLKSTDGGQSWNNIDAGLSTFSILRLTASPTVSGTLFTGVDIGTDAFIAKISATGGELLYSTYVGGGGNDVGANLAVDAAGNAYLAGNTTSRNIPATQNGFQSLLKGPSDAFVTKLNSAGSAFAWSTYLGGDALEGASAIALDGAGAIYLAGETTSKNFPLANPIQSANASVAPDTRDAFVSKFNADGARIEFSTYFGGRGADFATGIAVDGQGDAYVTGNTNSNDLPLKNPVQETNVPDPPFQSTDAFAARIATQQAALIYATYLGGTSQDGANSIAVDAAGNAYIAGLTFSTDFPFTANTLFQRGSGDAFLSMIGLRADLAVTIADLPDPVQANGDLTYEISVVNRGPDAAAGVAIRTALPAGLNPTSIQTSKGNCVTGNPVTCTLGDLAPNEKTILTIVVKPTAVGTLTARAEIVSNNTPDANADNNQASQDTRVTSTPSIFGRVRSAAGEGLADVSIGLGGAQRPAAITTAAGNYQFAELAAGADYTVTPQRQGYVFTPANRTVQRLTNDSRADFEAIACTFSIAPETRSVASVGGVENIAITSPDPRRTWTARSDVPWIRINGAASGTGSGSVQLTIDPTTAARSGAVLIAGRRLTIWQEFNACDPMRVQSVPGFSIGFSPNQTAGSIVTTDFNKDGISDLLTRMGDAQPGLFLSLSTSSGGYDAGRLIYRGRTFTYRPGDLNNDGNPDVLLTESESAMRLAALYGNGSGGFSDPVPIATPPDPRVFAIGDFNRDGRNDIAVSATVAPPSGPIPTTYYISILLGNAAGGFAAPNNIAFTTSAGSFVSQIETGDFNGDGKMDLAAMTNFTPVIILTGDGTGMFTTSSLGFFGPEGFLAVGDFNNDQKSDLVLSKGASDSIRPWLSTPSGALEQATPIDTGRYGRNLLVGDFNADGNADLLLHGASGLIVMHGLGNGKFSPPVNYLVPFASFGFTLGEFNKDGKPDLYLSGPGATAGTLQMYIFSINALGLNAARGFSFARYFPNSTSPGSISPAVADFTGDGINDLAVVFRQNDYKLSFLSGDGGGQFQLLKTVFIPRDASQVFTQDFNGDQKPDLGYVYEANDGRRIGMLLNTGGGNFGEELSLSIPGFAYSLEYADFNRDGKIDFLISAQTNTRPDSVALYLGDGTGKFTKSPLSFNLGFYPARVLTGDFNGDGFVDLLAYRYESTACGMGANPLVMLPGDGKGGFGEALTINLKERIANLVSADVNSDGKDDLVFTGSCAANVSFYVMLARQTGGFTLPVAISGNPPGTILAIRDFNNDGRLDVLQAAAGPGALTYFLGKGDGSFALSTSLRASWSRVLAADVGNDGSTDLLLFTEGSEYAGVLLNQSSCPRPGAATAVSAASYVPFQAAPDSIAAVFGSNLATSTQVATTLPLPTSLGALSVSLRDSGGQERLAPLFFGSPGQVNLLVPPGTAAGTALLSVKNGSTTVAAGTARIGAVAPGLFSADGTVTGLAASLVFRGKADGTQVFEPLVRFDPMTNRFVPVPIDLSNPAEQVFLLLYATGVRNRSDLASVQVTIGGEQAEVSYAGAQGTLAGLDQINVRIPRTLAGRGLVDVVLTADGRSSNPIRIGIK